MKRIIKRVFALFLCVLVSGLVLAVPSSKAYAASTSFLSDDVIDKFIDIFYTAGSEAAERVDGILSGNKEGTYEDFKEIYSNISAFYGVVDNSFSEIAANEALSNISQLNNVIKGCIQIYDNAASFAESTNAIQKTVDGFQVLEGAMTLLGCGAYFPSGLSLALNVADITINIAGFLETQYFKENVGMYEYELQIAYYTGGVLPLPEAPNVVGFGLTQDEADSIYAQTYMKYYVKQMMDNIGETVSDSSGNTGNSITGGIVFEQSSYSIAINQTTQFTSSYYSSTEQTDITISYSSSNTSIFTVTSDGLVTPVNEGTAQLIATASNGSTARCSITVYTPKIYIEKLSFLEESCELAMNMQVVLAWGYYPSNANTATGVTFSSSDESILVVDSSGTVTPVNSGVANVIITSENGVKDTCEITVYPYNISENDTGYTIDKYVGDSTEAAIPASINDVAVTHVAVLAFEDCAGLISITLPDSVTSIGGYAFEGCSSLTSIIIPNTVTSISDYTFRDCTSLTSVIIPDSVTNIGDYAFDGCLSLKTVTIPSGVLTIERCAFNDCSNLEKIEIPDTVTSISEGVYNSIFNGCGSLVAINVDKNNVNYSSVDGVLFNKNQTTLIKYPANKADASYIISSDVVSISDKAFYGCKNLTSIIIPENINNIGKGAFVSCEKLEHVEYNAKNCDIDTSNLSFFRNEPMSPFDSCEKLSSVEIGSLVEVLPSYIFLNGNSITDVVFEENSNLIEIGAYSFAECINLTSVAIPTNVISIGDGAFRYCMNLSSATIPNSVSNIGEEAFYECNNLKSVAIPNGVTEIGICTFYNCNKLSSIIIPDSVTSIGYEAFGYCTSLKTLVLSKNLINIGNSAFYCCWELESINIPETVQIIESCAFSHCDSLTSLTIPGSVSAINSSAFRYCDDLSTVILEEGITSISASAFSDCPVLAKIEIPESVEVIDTTALKNCTKVVIYCQNNSTAHTFAINNNIPFMANDDNTMVDLKKSIIYTNCLNEEITDIMVLSQGVTCFINSNVFGTGVLVDVMKDDNLHSQYTLVVNGDTNGDSLCDVLDCFDVERASNGNTELSGVCAMAADSNSDDVVDITDYQAIVNKALAS